MGKLLIISGDDDFLRKQRAREAVEDLTAGADADALEIVPGDSGELRFDAVAGRLLEALRTPPFLTPEKVVWLRHAADLSPFGAADPVPAAREVLDFLSRPLPPELTVVIDGPGFDQRKSYARSLKAAGAEIIVCSAVRSGDRGAAERRRAEIMDTVRRAGKRIAPEAVQFLLEAVGGDAGVLANELEKVCCYVGEAVDISLGDCTAVVSRTPEAVSWEYTSAVVESKPEAALKLLDIILSPGDSEMRILSVLSGEFQKMIQTRQAMRELGITRVNPRTFDALAGEKERYPDNPLLKLHPYRAFKICQGAAAFSDAELAARLNLIRNAARDLVSGRGDRRFVLERLTLALSAPAH